MVAQKICLLDYTGAAWRKQKSFQMNFGADHAWIPLWPHRETDTVTQILSSQKLKPTHKDSNRDTQAIDHKPP